MSRKIALPLLVAAALVSIILASRTPAAHHRGIATGGG